MYTRCSICRGSKKIKGLGNMEKECPECKGIGFVSDAPKVVVETVEVAKESNSTITPTEFGKLLTPRSQRSRSKSPVNPVDEVM